MKNPTHKNRNWLFRISKIIINQQNLLTLLLVFALNSKASIWEEVTHKETVTWTSWVVVKKNMRKKEKIHLSKIYRVAFIGEGNGKTIIKKVSRNNIVAKT